MHGVIRRLLIIAISAGAVLGLIVLTRWGAEPVPDDFAMTEETTSDGSPRKPAPRDNTYVGSARCKECHADISREYQTHPMSHSLAKVLASPIENAAAEDEFLTPAAPRFDRQLGYRIEEKERQVLHHEFARDEAGEIYRFAVPVEYQIGSGQRGRSYVVNRDGLLFMSPVSWYSQEQRWDLSPGYDHNNMHFGRRVLDLCLSCHAGHVAYLPEAPDRFESYPFHEESIGCEKCHGPGERHIGFHRGELSDVRNDPIINPEDLDAVERESVCFQCHLQGYDRLTRYGRTDFDFRPGDDISEIWTIIVTGTRVDDDQTTGAVSQVEQMLSSVCHKQSGGRLGCVSCHDPHSSPAAEERVEYYRSRCLACHGVESSVCAMPAASRLDTSAQDSCIVCHMPRLRANDVPHTAQTEHRILRSPNRETSEMPSSEEFTFEVFGRNRIPDLEVNRALGILIIRHAEKSGDRTVAAEGLKMLRPWVAGVNDDIQAFEAVGASLMLTGQTKEAETVWRRALELDPRNERLLARLMALNYDLDRHEHGIDYAIKLIEVNPWNHQFYLQLAHMLKESGRLKESLIAAERALRLQPSEYSVHEWIAEVAERIGDEQKASDHRSLFERLRPKDAAHGPAQQP